MCASRVNPVGFVLPVIPRERENIPKLETSGPSNNPAPSRESNSTFQEICFNEEDKVTWLKAAYFFITKSNKSKNEKIKKLNFLINLAKSANVKYLHGEEVNANTLATAFAEIIVYYKLAAAASANYPPAIFALGTSALANLLRPQLQEALILSMEQQQKNWFSTPLSGLPTDRNLLRITINRLSLLAYGTLEVASWPDRILGYFSKQTVDTIKQANALVAQGTVSAGKGYYELFKEVTVSDIFPATIEGRLIQMIENHKQTSKMPVLRSATGQEEGGDYETLDQLTEEEMHQSSDDQKQPEKPTGNVIRFSEKPVAWPNPNQPHPISDYVGGQFSISSGPNSSDGPSGLNYSAQVDVIVWGPKDLPAGAPAERGDPDMKRIVIDGTHIYKPIQKALEHLAATYQDYSQKKKELREAQANLSSKDHVDDFINKSQVIVAKTEEAKVAAKRAMEAAYALHKLTCTRQRRDYAHRNIEDEDFSTYNQYAKDILWNEFKVPQLDSLKREHLSQSGTLQMLQNSQASYANNLSIAKQDQQFFKTYQQFCELEASIKKIENTDGPIDSEALSEALATIQILGSQLKGHMQNTSSFSGMNATDLHIETRIAHLNQRDERYARIISQYQQFCEQEKSLLLELIKNKQTPEEFIQKIAKQKENLEKQIHEITSQCPDQIARNGELKLIQDDIHSKFSLLSFCQLPLEQQCAQQESLKEQIKNKSEQTKIDIFSVRSLALALQLRAHKDYENLSLCFKAYVAFLTESDSVSSKNIALLNEMSSLIKEAVISEKIRPNSAIHLLMAFEEKKLSSGEDLDPIRMTIGELFLLSDMATTPAAKQSYQCCKKIQPADPKWPRALGLSYLETLHWSLAENFLLEALAIDPNNKETKKIISLLVADKYHSISLLLEWIHTLTSNVSSQKAKPLSRLERFTQVAIKAVNISTHILSHPSLLKKWIPHLPLTFFNNELTVLLKEETSTNFNLVNVTTFSHRVVVATNSIIKQNFSKESYPALRQYTKRITHFSTALQPFISSYLFITSVRDLYKKYSERHLSGASYLFTTSYGFLNQLTLFIPFLKKLAFKNELDRLRSERSHPYLHAVIETIGSRTFAATLFRSDLVLRSRNLISRAMTRLTGVRTGIFEKIINVAVCGYFLYGTSQSYRHAYTTFVRPSPQAIVPEPKQETSYLGKMWKRFTSALGFS